MIHQVRIREQLRRELENELTRIVEKLSVRELFMKKIVITEQKKRK